MPLYRFIVHADKRIDDPEGEEYPDDASALAEAANVVRELRRDYGEDCQGWSIEVRSDGRLIALIPFNTVE